MDVFQTRERLFAFCLVLPALLLLAILPNRQIYARSIAPADASNRALPPFTVDPLHVQGNHIVNSAGQTIILRGATRISLEYGCLGGDGHFTYQDFQVMRGWGMNAVRFTLNSDFWLYGNSGCSPTDYHHAVDSAVQNAEAAGLAPILVLQWIGNDTQRYMPKLDGITFWQQVASRYASNPAVMFTPYAEPNDYLLPTTGRLTWAQWRDGISCTDPNQPANSECGAMGMQALTTTINVAAPNHVVFVSGNEYATSLEGLVNGVDGRANGYRLTGSNIVYEVHLYDEWSPTRFAPILAYAPVIAGEYGIQVDQRNFVETEQRAFEQYGTGYFAWAWNTGDPHSLISAWDGTPSFFGQHVRDYLFGLFPSFQPIVQPNPAPPAPVAGPVLTGDTCPSPWTCDDIGYGSAFGGSPPDGNQLFNGNSATLHVAGTGLNGTNDSTRFVWHYNPGDGAISARVTSQSTTSGNGEAGVMVRQEWRTPSPFYAAIITQQGQIQVLSRGSYGAPINTISLGNVNLPIGLRVIHTGTTFAAATSTNGTTWNAVANSTQTLNFTAYGVIEGVMAASGIGNTLTENRL